MVDPVQFILLAVIIILTLLLVILGIQVFFILSEARKAVSKTNTILEKADSITESVKTPLAAVSSLALGVKASSLLSIAKFIRSLLSHDKSDDEEKRHNKS
jgi:hypothetical protein